jgi:hypothetical protein
VGIIVDAVFLLEVLNVFNGAGSVRLNAVVRVEKDFFETAGERHPIVGRKILQQRGETLFVCRELISKEISQ